MHINLVIPVEQYNPFLEKAELHTREYVLLRNGIIKRKKKVVEVPCELEQAKQLLKLAKDLHPEVARSIEEGIRLHRAL